MTKYPWEETKEVKVQERQEDQTEDLIALYDHIDKGVKEIYQYIDKHITEVKDKMAESNEVEDLIDSIDIALSSVKDSSLTKEQIKEMIDSNDKALAANISRMSDVFAAHYKDFLDFKNTVLEDLSNFENTLPVTSKENLNQIHEKFALIDENLTKLFEELQLKNSLVETNYLTSQDFLKAQNAIYKEIDNEKIELLTLIENKCSFLNKQANKFTDEVLNKLKEIENSFFNHTDEQLDELRYFVATYFEDNAIHQLETYQTDFDKQVENIHRVLHVLSQKIENQENTNLQSELDALCQKFYDKYNILNDHIESVKKQLYSVDASLADYISSFSHQQIKEAINEYHNDIEEVIETLLDEELEDKKYTNKKFEEVDRQINNLKQLYVEPKTLSFLDTKGNSQSFPVDSIHNVTIKRVMKKKRTPSKETSFTLGAAFTLILALGAMFMIAGVYGLSWQVALIGCLGLAGLGIQNWKWDWTKQQEVKYFKVTVISEVNKQKKQTFKVGRDDIAPVAKFVGVDTGFLFAEEYGLNLD